jgi:hypothetical protein
MFAGFVTVGVGFTVMVNVLVGPVQKFVPDNKYLGVTVMVAIIGALVLFVAVKEVIFPVPFAARPIVGVLFTQV